VEHIVLQLLQLFQGGAVTRGPRGQCRVVREQAESTDGCLGRGCKGLKQESDGPHCGWGCLLSFSLATVSCESLFSRQR